MRTLPPHPDLRPLPARPLRRAVACLACGLVATVLLGTPAQAQYKWKDSRGQVHVSDLPPPREIPDRDVLQRPAARLAAAAASASPVSRPAAAAPVAPAATPTGSSPTRTDPELEARRKRAEQEDKARAQADENRAAALRAENCQRARQWLANLDTGQRIVRFNDRGERVVLDDSARAAEVDSARRAIATECR